ncbi:MAG TPA: radical SAM protein [Pyrinomonadaceae bacterium]|jgi:MoaA/NifB/PqqE/SkfB family radical SAM enzyme|nr:radical SAM protein [Pyrinomonadaceae bacterium]
MKKTDLFRAWGRILTGHYPTLSIEITRECPLRCPGCYAYEPEHLGDVGPLRSLADYKGQELIDGVLDLVRRYRPLHLSIVGGEPLVRFRELDTLLPRLDEMGVEVQLVTSAVRQIPKAWARLKNLYLVVSIDGLQPDHDVRRKPATYERILQNIEGHSVTVHCTVTRQMTGRQQYFEEFLSFWSAKPEVKKVWFSLFTPQVGAEADEILSADEREQVLTELIRLRSIFPKLYLPGLVLQGYRRPPQSPAECIFARTTLSFTADLENRITPCQFGGNPDCSQCGCFASAGMKALGDYRVLGFVPVMSLYNASDAIGKTVSRVVGRNGQANGQAAGS